MSHLSQCNSVVVRPITLFVCRALPFLLPTPTRSFLASRCSCFPGYNPAGRAVSGYLHLPIIVWCYGWVYVIWVRDAIKAMLARQNERLTGKPRNVEEIRECVLRQLQLATYGIAAPVEALQTATGTKDKIAQHWIDILIPKAREMRAASPGRDPDLISNELMVWLSTQINVGKILDRFGRHSTGSKPIQGLNFFVACNTWVKFL
ncbi:hypothetical protein B0H10DRAFT_1248089 [Mycena sp. CBHHK59/15]|nr:hypothetical protein B0H10DRAFT_1248089 [Mycena sp. CBHHK59/15]